MENSLIFDKSSDSVSTDNVSFSPGIPDCDISSIFPGQVRHELTIPDLGESAVVRHYSRLARKNFSVDTNFYPLGSCTMKYNPKLNEDTANLDGFKAIHPYQPPEFCQGALYVLYHLEKLLTALTGMDSFSLQPSSGAQGELTGLLVIRKYHQSIGNNKTTVIIPDSAHGTNPATAAMCGYKPIVIESKDNGLIDIEELKSLIDQDTAAIMLTNPNTLGLFEENILEISDIIHGNGGLLYYDGANFNPLLAVTKPAVMGFDVLHLNLHKTFSTPHGCGGPGAGAVGVIKELSRFLPVPRVTKSQDGYRFDFKCPDTIGRVRGFYGNFTVLVRAYSYLLRLGRNGLLNVSQTAVVNANYIKERLKDTYTVPYSQACMHEVVLSCDKQKQNGVSALDIAKRLIDYGYHPPTMYFPLIVKEALMIEPTETESKQTIDAFIEAMISINKEISTDIARLKEAPANVCVRRVDEVFAARNPNLRWQNPSLESDDA